MINEIIKKLVMVFLVAVSFACSTAPDKLQPYWLQTANDFMIKGVELYERQQYRSSAIEFAHALNTYQRFDYVKGLAQSYLNLAKSEVAQNNIEKAKAYLNDLIILIEENDLKSMSILIHMDIMSSSIAISEDKENQAIDVLNKYLGPAGENKMRVEDDVYMALLINRTRVAVKTNIDSNKWASIYEARANISEVHQARLLRFKGQIASYRKEIDLINEYFLSALILYREQANPKSVLLTLKEWGEALMENGQLTDAAKHFEKAYKVALSALNRNEMYDILGSLRNIYKELGDDENHQRVSRMLEQ